ncbi:MAG TPA: VacJ family lipoprotein [Candidatus Paceibacterota bacterium]|nr:VacJ family lipoprotein [Candidatus Paceibacterota bacterium]
MSKHIVAAALAALTLAGCASAGGQNDPFEGVNRKVFAFNERFDDRVAIPATHAYHKITTPGIRAALHDIVQNLREPINFFNDLGQGDFSQAGVTLGRMALNSTAGLGGIGDPAAKAGLPYREEDFGQTLAVWGAPEGSYLVLPLLGPSSPRALAGRAADAAMNPFSYASFPGSHALHWVRYGGGTLDQAQRLSGLRGIERESLDAYATERSLYRQNLAHEIANGHEQPPDIPQ